MTAPIDIYHQFQQLLQKGDWEHLHEVVDVEGYTENCVGITGWTTGLQTAAANFQKYFVSAFRDMTATDFEVVQSDDLVAIRRQIEAVHVGTFLGHPGTNRKVKWEAVDLVRVKQGKIVWRYLLCDWHGLEEQINNRLVLK